MSKKTRQITRKKNLGGDWEWLWSPPKLQEKNVFFANWSLFKKNLALDPSPN